MGGRCMVSGISGVERCPRRLRPEGMSWLDGALGGLERGIQIPGLDLCSTIGIIGEVVGGGTRDVIGGSGPVPTYRRVCVVELGWLKV